MIMLCLQKFYGGEWEIKRERENGFEDDEENRMKNNFCLIRC